MQYISNTFYATYTLAVVYYTGALFTILKFPDFMGIYPANREDIHLEHLGIENKDQLVKYCTKYGRQRSLRSREANSTPIVRRLDPIQYLIICPSILARSLRL